MCLGVHVGVVLGLCYVFPFGASRVGDGRGGNLGSYAEGLVGGGLVGGASRRSDFGWSRFFAWDRFLHCWEFREWAWPFSLSVALVLAGILNGLVSVPLGLWLNSRAEKVRVRVAGRRR